MRERKAGLLDFLSRGPETAAKSFVAVTPQQAHYFGPIGVDGHRRWVLNTVAFEIDASLNGPRLETALRKMVQRHALLRAEFREVDGFLACGIRDGVDVDVVVQTRESLARDLNSALASFEPVLPPDSPPLWTVAATCSPTGSVLFVAMSHLISDAWSMHVFVAELLALYEDPTRADLNGAATDFGHWATGHCGQPVHVPPIAGPDDNSEVRVERREARATRSSVLRLAQHHRITPFALLFGAFAAAVGRASGVPRLTVAVPVGLRLEQGDEEIIGPILCNRAVKIELPPGEPVPFSLLRAAAQARSVITGDEPGTVDAEELRVRFNFLDFHNRKQESARVHLRRGEIAASPGKFDLKLYVWYEAGPDDWNHEQSSDAINLKVVYRPSHFSATTIEAVISHFDAGLVELGQMSSLA